MRSAVYCGALPATYDWIICVLVLTMADNLREQQMHRERPGISSFDSDKKRLVYVGETGLEACRAGISRASTGGRHAHNMIRYGDLYADT